MGITALLAHFVVIVAGAVAAGGGGGNIVVAHESGVDAYRETLEGIEAALGPHGLTAVDVRVPGADLGRALSGRQVQVVIAIGARAASEVEACKPQAPVIEALILRQGAARAEGEAWGRIDLDVPLDMQLAAARSLWPKFSRAGIIRNPARSRYTAEALAALARKEGFVAQVVDCDGPAQLLKAIALLKGKVDFLLCFPDPDLYNAVTVKPLLVSALENRLPIVGFSPAFVRAGAAAGVYPDYRDAGRQAGEMAERLFRGGRGGEEAPRKVQLAVNQRVAHLLGVEYRQAQFPLEVFR